ncbi:hypothetical protein DRP04_04150 [Archaeoglobales archaeon]|nr:MAG: hypothetical protein DRP04_04150 [Archaeoglobales archaeon]
MRFLTEDFESFLRKNRKLIAILAIALLLICLGNFTRLETVGYLTATQGLEAQFAALRVNGIWLSEAEKPSTFSIKDRELSAENASNWFFGYELDFDPDEQDDGFPNLLINQQPFTVKTNPFGEVEYDERYAWQVDKGIVTLSNGSKARKVIQFEMWRCKLSWALNIWLSGPKAESCDRAWHGGIAWEPDYGGTEIWIKLKSRNFAYFQDNPDEVYFAPAYFGVEYYEIASIDQDNRKTLDDPDMTSCIDLNPKERGETCGIYYERGGTPIDIEETLLTYENVELDPAVFRNEYWIHIDLVTFKPWNHIDFWWKTHSYKWPSITLHFIVYVFVVGKWTVYLSEDEVPQLTPHTPPSLVRRPWSWLTDWWSNPWTLLWTGIFGFFVLLIVIAILAIFAPGALTAITRTLFGRRRET